MQSWIALHVPVSILLRLDPLVMTTVCGAMRMGVTITLLGALTLGISLLLGRVFCGWVCPLGAVFDFYGWFLRRIRTRFEGPSPPWYLAKYYLLAAILLFAILGGVSPLMGFDPIVLITRTAAVVFMPLWRQRDHVAWSTGSPLGLSGYLIDTATLVLFIGIMAGTTRLSRFWCRTACPLGAYLAVLSRHSVLRRQTDGCVHCNICSRHCPTGAINFENAEIYNESECIKCFACSQECPIDVNFFTFKSPLPAFTETYAPVSLKRRTLLTTTVAAVAAAPVLNLSAGTPKAYKKLLRPPMSREEHDFLSSCIRCNECSKACPTGILKPAFLEHGVRALWSPVMVAAEGFCQEGCNACSQACPTDAILKYPIEHKYDYKTGTATFESSRCISYADGKFCSECIRACPTQAIEFERGWEPAPAVANPGTSQAETKADDEKQVRAKNLSIGSSGSDMPAPTGLSPTRPIRINFDRCVGCGACEFECTAIVSGEPAMILTSFGRALPTRLEN